MGATFDPFNAGGVVGHCGRLDSPLFRFRRSGRHYPPELREEAVRRAHRRVGTGRQPGIIAILRATVWRETADRVRRICEWLNLPYGCHFAAGFEFHDGRRTASY